MEIILSIILSGCISWGVSIIITQESGPFAIFDRIRLWAISKVIEIPEINMPVINDNNIASYIVEMEAIKEKISSYENFIDSIHFTKNIYGTLFHIMNCHKCAGLWVNIPFSVLLSKNIYDFIIIYFGGFFVHAVINRYLV